MNKVYHRDAKDYILEDIRDGIAIRKKLVFASRFVAAMYKDGYATSISACGGERRVMGLYYTGHTTEYGYMVTDGVIRSTTHG